ncbi:hypothetical protein D3C86_2055890 [compost metagenome]
MAHQFIGQRGGRRQRGRFCKSGDIFHQAFNFFTNDVRILHTFEDIELNFAQRVELHKAFGRFQSLRQRNQQISHSC